MAATGTTPAHESSAAAPRPTALLYYDGECPICSRYRDYLAIRVHHDLELRDARQYPEELGQLARAGNDINQGMILVLEDAVHSGPAAALAVDTMARRGGFLDLLARPLLRHPQLLRAVYPLLKLVRTASLRLKGVNTRIETH